MRVVAPAVRAVELDTSKDEFLQMDELVRPVSDDD
jgi:hypothetical protein